MKKALILCGALLLVAATANAQVHLAWDNCAGPSAKVFACNTNSGNNVIVGTFIAPSITALTGEEIAISVESGVPTLPKWWTVGATPNCRPISTFASVPGDGAGFADCADYFATYGGAGGINYQVGQNFVGPATNAALLRMVYAIDAGVAIDPLTVQPALGGEYYAFQLTIKHNGTVGVGSCTGCSDGVTLTLNQIKLTQPVGVGDFTLTGGPNHCDWDGGVTPTTNTSWGTIKALYR